MVLRASEMGIRVRPPGKLPRAAEGLDEVGEHLEDI